ncbi:hypothetical protein ACLB2K_049191 [Fragaria x ananassa]
MVRCKRLKRQHYNGNEIRRQLKDLPMDLLVDILLRLPVESLRRIRRPGAKTATKAKSCGGGSCVDPQISGRKPNSCAVLSQIGQHLWSSKPNMKLDMMFYDRMCLCSGMRAYIVNDFEACWPSEKLAHNEKLQKPFNLLFLGWNKGDVDLTTGNKNAMSVGSKKKQRCLEIC